MISFVIEKCGASFGISLRRNVGNISSTVTKCNRAYTCWMLVNLLHVDSTERPPRCRDSGDKYRQLESPLDTWQFLWQTSDVRCNVVAGINARMKKLLWSVLTTKDRRLPAVQDPKCQIRKLEIWKPHCSWCHHNDKSIQVWWLETGIKYLQEFANFKNKVTPMAEILKKSTVIIFFTQIWHWQLTMNVNYKIKDRITCTFNQLF